MQLPLPKQISILDLAPFSNMWVIWCHERNLAQACLYHLVIVHTKSVFSLIRFQNMYFDFCLMILGGTFDTYETNIKNQTCLRNP